jgi:hypothetical protein
LEPTHPSLLPAQSSWPGMRIRRKRRTLNN